MKKIKYAIFVLLTVIVLVGCDSSSDDTDEAAETSQLSETTAPEETETPTPTPTQEATPLPLPNALETAAPQKDASYIIPDSNSRLLSAEEVAAMDANTKQMAINEIYARHGRLFDTPEIQEYFNSKAWYQGSVPAASFDESVFNKYERSNISSLSGQPYIAEDNSSYNIYFAGRYGCELSVSPREYIELAISLYTDSSLDYSQVGDEVGNVEIYDTEYFPDGINSETDYRYGLIYKTAMNCYDVHFDDGYICTFKVDESGISVAGSGLDGYYSLIEHFYS